MPYLPASPILGAVVRGDEWLAQVFEPRLSSGGRSRRAELTGAVDALAACGVLSRDQAAKARRRLARYYPTSSRATVPGRAVSQGREDGHEWLETVAAPAADLGCFQGVDVLLVSIELWSSKIVVRLAAQRDAVTASLDAEYAQALERWSVHTTTLGRAHTDGPPSEPGASLLHLPLSIVDDRGASYEAGRRSAGGTGSEWQSEWAFTPGAAPEARWLHVRLETDEGTQVTSVAIPQR